MFRISRKPAYADRLRAYRIILDDKRIGYISENETKDFDIEPGKHILYLKIDWARSNKISFETDGSELIEFEAVSGLDNGKVFFAIFYLLFLFTKWIKLTKV